MYLEVKIGTTMDYPELTAFSANGYSLGEPQGCLGALFSTTPYPYAEDYIRELQYEAWNLYQVDGAISRSTIVMHDG